MSNDRTINLNLDVKPTSVQNETVEVIVNPSDLLASYAKNFVNEALRKHPLLAEQVSLTDTEVQEYAKYLLRQRVEHVNGNRKSARFVNLLYVPVWIEYTISNVGKLIIRDLGLTFVPKWDENLTTITDSEAKAISERIAMFEDVLQIVKNAFPNDDIGDQDLMTTALIADYVRATKELAHPVTTYLTAFLGLKLREENAFKVLYRVQYDDLSYLAQALDSEGPNIC